MAIEMKEANSYSAQDLAKFEHVQESIRCDITDGL